MASIDDGKGRGFRAGVDQTGRLEVASATFSEELLSTYSGDAFALSQREFRALLLGNIRAVNKMQLPVPIQAPNRPLPGRCRLDQTMADRSIKIGVPGHAGLLALKKFNDFCKRAIRFHS